MIKGGSSVVGGKDGLVPKCAVVLMGNDHGGQTETKFRELRIWAHSSNLSLRVASFVPLGKLLSPSA